MARENRPKSELLTGLVLPVSNFKIKSGHKKQNAAIVTQQMKAKKRLFDNNLKGEVPLTKAVVALGKITIAKAEGR